MEDIAHCATLLPTSCAGRDLLLHLSSPSDAIHKDQCLDKAAREVECYLLSLAIRSYYRANHYQVAYDLSLKAIAIADAYLSASEGKLNVETCGGMYPLRSRLVRYRSLVGEALGRQEGDLSARYRSAVLAKDGDGICTVLNLMLRDLLAGDQGE